jgi:hypothetical protein
MIVAEIVAMTSRILAIAWGIATVVLIANYTASLAGFVTAVNAGTSVKDLADIKDKT